MATNSPSLSLYESGNNWTRVIVNDSLISNSNCLRQSFLTVNIRLKRNVNIPKQKVRQSLKSTFAPTQDEIDRYKVTTGPHVNPLQTWAAHSGLSSIPDRTLRVRNWRESEMGCPCLY